MTTTVEPAWQPSDPELSPEFSQAISPTPVPDPKLVAWNPVVAEQLGIEGVSTELIDILAGNRVPEPLRPHATGYAGHQFGVWVPELGDGRAITLGSIAGIDKQGYQIQLKGSGPTQWSRRGDGRAVLRSTVREYLASAAMAGLGIPTTAALAIVTSDLPVYRERTEQAAILSRVAKTHIRFGSFQWLASLGRRETLKGLADRVIQDHFHGLLVLPESERYSTWYGEVVARTARLMARWIAVGFAHGVMNTDNFSIIGDTLDYGPFGWLDEYDPTLICNHSDWEGRYRFDQQPMVGLWNCARLGEALVPLFTEGDAMAALERYQDHYQVEVIRLMRLKLGLTAEEESDTELATDFLGLLHVNSADYHRSFRTLSRWEMENSQSRLDLLAEVGNADALDAWLERYQFRLNREQMTTAKRHREMLQHNPKYVLRNWVAQEAIQNAEKGNIGRIDEIRQLLAAPFDEHPDWERYAEKPPAWAREIVVSCSS